MARTEGSQGGRRSYVVGDTLQCTSPEARSETCTSPVPAVTIASRARASDESRVVAKRKREATASQRSLHSVFAGMRRSVPVAPTRPTAVVVRAETAPVGRVVPNALLELRSVLDLILRAVHEDLFVLVVGPLIVPAGSITFLPKIQGPVSTTMYAAPAS